MDSLSRTFLHSLARIIFLSARMSCFAAESGFSSSAAFFGRPCACAPGMPGCNVVKNSQQARGRPGGGHGKPLSNHSPPTPF